MVLSISLVVAATVASPIIPADGFSVIAPACSEIAMHGGATSQVSSSSRARRSMPIAFDSSMLALFESGRPYKAFLEHVTQRREGWVNFTETAQADAALVARARAVAGNWKLLVVAIDACNDSMNSVPFIARMIEGIGTIEMRIVSPSDGKAVQESHRTLDGRMATPTFVLLDASGKNVGCIVELPRELRHATHALRTAGKIDEAQAGKRAFYERDKGRSITAEVVEMLEGAGAGKPLCEKGS